LFVGILPLLVMGSGQAVDCCSGQNPNALLKEVGKTPNGKVIDSEK
jgi:hypothetical protein